MSNRYKGAVISATPPTTTGGESGTASGAWTLEQQMQLMAAGLWPIQPLPKYIEDVFSTYLYTGTGAAQTITNGINLSGNGGLVWSKARSISQNNSLIDTVRGNGSILYSDLNSAADTGVTTGVTAFNTTGYALGSGSFINQSGATYASWTFREQPKFFDVVTYTGNGVAGRTVAHNLGSVPGCIIVKMVTLAGYKWRVYHVGANGGVNPQNYALSLNESAAQEDDLYWNDTAPTATEFTVGSYGQVNNSGSTFVAYLFAHNAGGFGLNGTDNVISCGSYTGGGTPQINLGYEPQWVMVKQATYPASPSNAGAWYIVDNMRTFPYAGSSNALEANLANGENGWFNVNFIVPTATGFNITYPASGGGSEINDTGQTYIYVAIRRGPMAVPTVGTSVFTPIEWSGADNQTLTPGFPPDLVIQNANINSTPSGFYWGSRMQGNTAFLTSASTGAEGSFNSWQFNKTTGTFTQSITTGTLGTSIDYFFRRAPSVFDQVCYTGDGASPRSITHNLGVAPELMIVKKRNTGDAWAVGAPAIGATKELWLNSAIAAYTDAQTFSSTPTSTVFNIGFNGEVNTSGGTYVAFLFATCAGVSKVGSYTGTGAAQTINCGFTAGARFVLIKRTDSTGDWYVWDSARGIIPSNDPYLLLNSTAAQVTGTDYIDTTSVGFDITSTAPAAINASGGTYIFLAIA